MSRIRNSIELFKSSWNVLSHDKELLVLPVLSSIATLVVAATFLVPLLATGGLDTSEEVSTTSYAVLFAMYLVLAYVTIFFNAALVSAAHERLTGGDPTLRSALGGAAARAGKILPWAVVSATVSVVLRALEDRAGVVGRIVLALAGAAWAVVTFLVLPIIVIEGLGVGDAIRKSGALFRQTWGENLAAQAGFSIIGFLAALPAIALIVLGALVGGAVLGAAIALAAVWLILLAVVIAALSGIYQTALYHFAVDGRIRSEYFSNDALSAAFASKR